MIAVAAFVLSAAVTVWVYAGYPLEKRFGLGREAGLFCVTEVHTSEDIERLAEALEEAL